MKQSVSQVVQTSHPWTFMCACARRKGKENVRSMTLIPSLLYPSPPSSTPSRNALNLLPQKPQQVCAYIRKSQQQGREKKLGFFCDCCVVCFSLSLSLSVSPVPPAVGRDGRRGPELAAPLTTRALFFTSSQNACVFLCVITASCLPLSL